MTTKKKKKRSRQKERKRSPLRNSGGRAHQRLPWKHRRVKLRRVTIFVVCFVCVVNDSLNRFGVSLIGCLCHSVCTRRRSLPSVQESVQSWSLLQINVMDLIFCEFFIVFIFSSLVTPNDSVVRRSISQQKVAVSITIDDPVRTGRQLSPPRGKTSNIIHICNLVSVCWQLGHSQKCIMLIHV